MAINKALNSNMEEREEENKRREELKSRLYKLFD